MNRHPNALMLSLITLMMAIMGLGRLQKIGKHVLLKWLGWKVGSSVETQSG